jgi:hypothetical protein
MGLENAAIVNTPREERADTAGALGGWRSSESEEGQTRLS